MMWHIWQNPVPSLKSSTYPSMIVVDNVLHMAVILPMYLLLLVESCQEPTDYKVMKINMELIDKVVSSIIAKLLYKFYCNPYLIPVYSITF